MLREAKGARRLTDRVTLMMARSVVDDFGHAVFAEPELVAEVHASVRKMSATKALMTFQQANVIGVEIEFRSICMPFNLVRWRGHDIVFVEPTTDERKRMIRVEGYYQVDNPIMAE